MSEAKRSLALAAGAMDYVVSDDGLSSAVRALTGGLGADHAFGAWGVRRPCGPPGGRPDAGER
ncbi:hypothetical protein ACFQX7_00515 [Luedemannella flava]